MSKPTPIKDDIPLASASNPEMKDAHDVVARPMEERESHVWCIPLAKLRTEDRARVYSPEFNLDGEKWRLVLFPKGNPNHYVAGCMAAYIELLAIPAYCSVVCFLKMRMVHPKDPSKCKWRDTTHTFTHIHTDRGYNDLLTPANIEEYTHEGDGCVVLQVVAYKAPPGFQLDADYANIQILLDQDRREELLTRNGGNPKCDHEELHPSMVAVAEDLAGDADVRTCSICLSQPRSTLTLCCRMMRVCGSCMRQLLDMQSAGKMATACPNCTRTEFEGTKFGSKHVIFGIKL